MPLFQDAPMLQGGGAPQEAPPIDPNAQMMDQGPQDEQESSPDSSLEMLEAIADHILYDPKGITMIRQMVQSHMKDPAMGAALLTCAVLFQIKDRMQDLSEDQIVGKNSIAEHILDSIFEIFQHMKVDTNQDMFHKAVGLVAENYALANMADQSGGPQEAPSAPGGLFANPPMSPDQGAPQQ